MATVVTTPEAKIYKAIMQYLATVETQPVLRRDEPNVSFDLKLDEPYVAITYLPNMATLDGLAFDSDETHIGLLQLSIFWPSKAGILKPLQVAGQYVGAFKPGTRIDLDDVVVEIDQLPTVAGPLQESDWVQVPVTVRWRASVPAAA